MIQQFLQIFQEESDAITDLLWEANWTPQSAGNFTLSATVTDWAGFTQTRVFPIPIAVDIDPPTITIENTYNSQNFFVNGQLVLQGTFNDDAGVESVKVILINEELSPPLSASLIGDGSPQLTKGIWQASWFIGWELPLDGESYNIVVEATDRAGRTAQMNQNVDVDVHAPAPLSLSFSNPLTGETIEPGTTLTASPATVRLNLEQDPSEDPTIKDIVVYWHVSNDQRDSVTEISHNSLNQIIEFNVDEAAELSVQIMLQDNYGNERWQSLGPIFIDGPLTPDYIKLPGAFQVEPGDVSPNRKNDIYRGWQENECTLIGIDNRILRNSNEKTSLNNEQRFFVTWDTLSLRLSWMGANWEHDGDLFIYLDTVEGGSVKAFDPFNTPQSKTSILFPIDANGTQMAADYVIWVKNSHQAEILAWDSSILVLILAIIMGGFRLTHLFMQTVIAPSREHRSGC